MFDTPVTQVTLVVVDPSHARYGQTAQLTAHDWKEYGTMFALFPDGEHAELHDGMMSDDLLLPQAARILTKDRHGLQALRQTLEGARVELSAIAAVAKNEKLPKELRMQAKKSFANALDRLLTSDLIH